MSCYKDPYSMRTEALDLSYVFEPPTEPRWLLFHSNGMRLLEITIYYNR